MTPAYPVNPRPNTTCDCGPRLMCLHHVVLVPIDTRELRIADPDPAENNTSAVPAAKPASDPTNTEGTTHV